MQPATMDAVLRQSKAMCPFLMKTSPATLRQLSTSTRHASPGGGRLTSIARRCPVMGKALVVQQSRGGLGGIASALRAYTGKSSSGKAKIHTSRPKEARAVDDKLFGLDKGTPKTTICGGKDIIAMLISNSLH